MSFKKEFSEMIKNNCEAYRMIEASRIDDINKDTMFIVAACEINNGMMCGGDGVNAGEWAWANNIDDFIDYITDLAIPFNLCMLEDQDPQVVLDDSDNSFVFNYEYQEKHLPIRDELKRLYYALKEIKQNGATFDAVKKELYRSNKNAEKIDGELIFRFYWFENLNKALEVIKSNINFNDDFKSVVQEMIDLKVLTKEDQDALYTLFVNTDLEGDPKYLDDKDYVLLKPNGKNNPFYEEESNVSNIMFEYDKNLDNNPNALTLEESQKEAIEFLINTGRKVYIVDDVADLDKVLTDLEEIKDERYELFSKGKYETVYEHNFYENRDYQTYFVVIKKTIKLEKIADDSISKLIGLLQTGKAAGIHFILSYGKWFNKELKEKLRANCSCRIFTK